MKKIWLMMTLFTILCTAVTFAYSGSYSAMDVAEVKSQGRDDQHVVLTGQFVEHLRGDHYLFEDQSGGQIVVDVDDDHTYRITLNQSIRVYGEIEAEHGQVKIDADRVETL